MSWRVILTALWVVCSWHYPNQLHHAAVFMGQNVAMKYESAGEIRILLSYGYSARNNLRAIDLRRGNSDHVLPYEVICWRVSLFYHRRVNFNYLERVDVDVKRMGDSCRVVLEHPVLQSVLGHALVDYRTCFTKLSVIDLEVGRIGIRSWFSSFVLPLELHW